MAKSKKPSTLYSVGFMILLAAIFTGILAGLNIVTAKSIESNSLIEKQRAVLKASGIDASDDQVADIFEKDFKLISEEAREVYEYKSDDKSGYIFSYQGGGLWGQIIGYVGITEDKSKLLGISVYNNNETPGLGGRITEDWYQDQFRELEVSDGDFIVYTPAAGGNVDAITGATLTSNAMRDMLNKEIHSFLEEEEGGKYEK